MPEEVQKAVSLENQVVSVQIPQIAQVEQTESDLEDLPILLLCGVNATLVATAQLARQCGFIVDVADTSELAFLQNSFPMARHCFSLPTFDALLETCSICSRHYVVIMTGSVATNKTVLRQILTSHAFYVGMHGDEKEWKQLQTSLRLEGFPTIELAAVRCPVGLAIDGKTDTRRAVAIVAEMLAAQAGTLKRLSNI